MTPDFRNLSTDTVVIRLFTDSPAGRLTSPVFGSPTRQELRRTKQVSSGNCTKTRPGKFISIFSWKELLTRHHLLGSLSSSPARAILCCPLRAESQRTGLKRGNEWSLSPSETGAKTTSTSWPIASPARSPVISTSTIFVNIRGPSSSVTYARTNGVASA